jgi:hypothetical protein
VKHATTAFFQILTYASFMIKFHLFRWHTTSAFETVSLRDPRINPRQSKNIKSTVPEVQIFISEHKLFMCPIKHSLHSSIHLHDVVLSQVRGQLYLHSGTLHHIQHIIYHKIKLKVKLPLCLTEHHAMNAYWGSGSIDPYILDLGTRWRWVVSFTCRPLYPQGKSLWYPLNRRLVAPQRPSGHGGEEKYS